MKKTNKGLVILSILSMFISMLSSGFIIAEPVSANSGTGGGNAGSGDTGYWRKIDGDPKTQGAWNEFYRLTAPRYGGNWLNKEIAAAGNKHGNSQLLEQCKASRYIWYYSDSGSAGIWYNMGSYTHNAPWIGGKPAASDWNDFQKWGGANWNKGNTVLVCSGSYEKPAPATRKEVEKDNRDVKDNVVINGVYTKESTINPVATQEYNTYTEDQRKAWDGTHEKQPSGAVLTAYGQWYKDNAANIKKLDSLTGAAHTNLKKQLTDGANAAKAKDLASPVVQMSAKNKQGFAKGGVFTMTEGVRDASITLTSKTAQSRERTNTETQQPNGTWKVTANGAWSAWKTMSIGEDGLSGQELKSVTPVKFWQMLHAKCNDPGVKRVMSNVPNIKDDSASASVSDTLRSPVYTKQAQLPLGDPKNAAKDLKDTAYDPFYAQTAGCLIPIDCISTPLGKDSTSDAKNNVQDAGDKRDGTYGAQGKVVDGKKEKVLSSDSFTYFRDNQVNDLRLDVWYPTVMNPASGITMKAGPALKTRMFFDPKGTPLDDMFAVTLDQTNSINKQKGLSGAEIAAGKGILVDGELSKLSVASSWASDNGKPQKVNADWVYNPTIRVELYDTISGAGGASNKVTVEANDLFVACKMELNKKDKNRPVGLDIDSKEEVTGLTEFDNGANRSGSVHYIGSGSGLNQQ